MRRSLRKFIAPALVVAGAMAVPAIAQEGAAPPRVGAPGRRDLPSALPAGAATPAQIERAREANALPPSVPITPTILDPNFRPIDLNSALRLAGVQNPDLMIARQRVVEAAALRQLAAVQILPTINLGGNFDSHTGVLQQSSGNILSVNRSAVYLGAGSNAVAAGTVNVPGVVLSGNVGQGIFAYLVVAASRSGAGVRHAGDPQPGVPPDDPRLFGAAPGRRGACGRDAGPRGGGRGRAWSPPSIRSARRRRKADADRFATELTRRQADVQRAEGEILVASARLCEVLNLDPSIRLHPTDAWVTPSPIVPDPIPVCQLVAMALLRRPELGERRAVIKEALLSLEGSRVLPFSPTVLVGFSAGGFGGGSNLVTPVFGGFGGRTDFDAVTYWTLQNMGVGNLAMIRGAGAGLRDEALLEEIAVMDRVRAEVAQARRHGRTPGSPRSAPTRQAVPARASTVPRGLRARIRERGEAASAPPIEAAQ